MKLSYDKLTDGQINEQLSTTPSWQVEGRELSKLFEFDSYKDGLVFASAVGYLADQLNHHPDLLVGYQKVRVSMTTHDAERSLTAYDFELARRIDRLTG